MGAGPGRPGWGGTGGGLEQDLAGGTGRPQVGGGGGRRPPGLWLLLLAGHRCRVEAPGGGRGGGQGLRGVSCPPGTLNKHLSVCGLGAGGRPCPLCRWWQADWGDGGTGVSEGPEASPGSGLGLKPGASSVPPTACRGCSSPQLSGGRPCCPLLVHLPSMGLPAIPKSHFSSSRRGLPGGGPSATFYPTSPVCARAHARALMAQPLAGHPPGGAQTSW